MAQNTDRLIAELVNTLQPVRPMRQARGMARAVLALLMGAAFLVMTRGIRPDLKTGSPDPMFLTASGLFLVLALASAWAVVDMARPFVGTRREGWGWTALMAAVLPVSALALALSDWLRGFPVTFDLDGENCLAFGIAIGLISAATLTSWLRRGAPSNPKRAGLLTGVASGAAGIFAASLACPHGDLLHIGVWHGATVITMGLAGRIMLPRALAW